MATDDIPPTAIDQQLAGRTGAIATNRLMTISFCLSAVGTIGYVAGIVIHYFYPVLDTGGVELIGLGVSLVSLLVSGIWFAIQREGNRLFIWQILFLLFGTALWKIVPFGCYICDNTNRMIACTNLRQISTAVQAYNDAHGHLPPAASQSPDGRPLLSWRVLILPYLGEPERNLYLSFHLDEPWDSPHNKKLIATMPSVYAPVKGFFAPRGTTLCKVFVGKGSVFEPGRKLTVIQIHVRDGITSTILVALSGDLIPWTKPEDLSFDSERPLNLSGSFMLLESGKRSRNIVFATVDGSDHAMSLPLDAKQEKNFRGLITWNGGENVRFDW